MKGVPADADARAEALDRSRSFIVQAPAGSGKTELLIQRFLALLETVRQPEQIVAITFTRKAAAQMRSRIIAALDAADRDEPVPAHRETTRDLARRVLARDRELGWQLLEQTQRLRIDTLDALNAWLAQQLPVLAGGIDAARIADDPVPLYALAARRTVARFADADAPGPELRRWLGHVSNSAARLEALLAGLLPVRDQWLRHMAGPVDDDPLRRSLERGLAAHVRERLCVLEDLVGRAVCGETWSLRAHVREHGEPLPGDPGAAPHDPSPAPASSHTAAASGHAAPEHRRAAPGAGLAELNQRLACWRDVADILLTRNDEWRRRFTKRHGLGPAHANERDRAIRLVEELQGMPQARALLAGVRLLPDPCYEEGQWRDLAALRRVLVHATAELRVLFAEHEIVDFIELALSAQEALGAVDAPSDLLLALDQRIEHVLVDEFQDTSQSQYRLLELLTAGWTPGDGRTLFLVGDPMQSIYRFRDADMSLFLRVKQEGLGGVRCEPLALETNFRSAPKIVSWLNRVFAAAFPEADSIIDGTARYHPCVAGGEPTERQGVHLHALESEHMHAELDRVTDILAAELADAPEQSIGILVQSRRHLVGLRARLRERGWAAHAIELESLAETQIGQDLIGLTRALLHLGDRIAWLALLRAPWCGLTWVDLERLCGGESELTIWQMLRDDERLGALSDDGRARAERLRGDLDAAFRERGRLTLARWIERCWRQLEGPACVTGAEDLDRAVAYFDTLGELARDGDLDDPCILHEALSRPRAHGDAPRERGIELMTIHRAKGLEFDTVVLLGLGRSVRGPEPRMLQWMIDGRGEGLFAPTTRAENRLNAYLGAIERRRDAAERCRLLYVATTRARERLHLVCALDPLHRAVPPRSLVAAAWPALADEFRAASIAPRTSMETDAAVPRLRRLAAREAALARRAVEPPVSRPAYEWAGQTALHVGTLVHRELQTIADRGLLDRYAAADRIDRYARALALLGVPVRELHDAADRVARAVEAVLADPRGRWILNAHDDARSELTLSLGAGIGIEHIRPDRTFVVDGTRWIVDFKTSRHEGGSREAFLAAERERYRRQLDRYASALRALDPRPVRVGLYFPLLGEFLDWAPALESAEPWNAGADVSGVERGGPGT